MKPERVKRPGQEAGTGREKRIETQRDRGRKSEGKRGKEIEMERDIEIEGQSDREGTERERKRRRGIESG